MEKLIQLKEKGKLSINNDSFLYSFSNSDKNIFIFDNHRLSLWSWLKFIDKSNFKKYSLIYIDKHIDCNCVDFDERYKIFFSNFEILKNLDKFRNFSFNRTCKPQLSGNPPLIHCANFLAFAIKLQMFNNIHIFTENTDKNYFKNQLEDVKDKFNLDNLIVHDSNTEENLINEFKKEKLIILDIDLDIFCSEENWFYSIDKKQILKVCEVIKQNKNKILLTNMALSPNCCGGWKKAEEVLSYFIKIFGLDLNIPLKIE